MIDFSDLEGDLDAEGSAEKPFTKFPCQSCAGTGKYQGHRTHQTESKCFACGGRGWFKTSEADRRKARHAGQQRKERKIDAAMTELLKDHGEMFRKLVEIAAWHEFAASLVTQANQRGTLTENQIAAGYRALERVEERRKQRDAEKTAKSRRLVDQGMTADELATATGATRYKIEWRLRLLSLTPEILQHVEGGQIDLQQATEIARLPDAAEQHRILRLINRGQIVGWRTLHNSISAILESKTVVDLFGDDAPKASDEEVAILNLMERKIETVVGMVAAGWREGQCVVAAKVSRDRSAVMAEKIRAIRQSLTRMESDLRNVTAQASIVMGEAA